MARKRIRPIEADPSGSHLCPQCHKQLCQSIGPRGAKKNLCCDDTWGDQARAGQPWTDDEDVRLISWGLAVGHYYVAAHDFGRRPSEGTERYAWLREHKPDLVRETEARCY